MQEIRKFYVKSKIRKKEYTWAVLEYNSGTQQFALHIDKESDWHKAPIMIFAYADTGRFDLDAEWSLRWVRDRIIPPNRANIGEILKAAGLTEYSEFGMLMYHRGRCVQDDMYIEEIVQ